MSSLLIKTACLVTTLLALQYSDNGVAGQSAKKVVGFFQFAYTYKGFEITDVKPEQYTHIKYAFVDVDAATSSCVVRDKFQNEERLFPSDDNTCRCCARGSMNQLFRIKEQNPGVSTMLAVGGWVWSRNFSLVARTPEKRKTFASSCLKIMTDYGMDGIDIDWEFPGSPGQNVGASGMIHSNDDTANMIEMMQEFRTQMDALKPGFLLTLDVAPIPWYLDAAQVKSLAGTLDWFNIMAYEFSLNGRRTTRHNSQLFTNPDDPVSGSSKYLTFENAVKWYLNAGVASEKIVMGLPAYGRQYEGVSGGEGGGLFGRIGGARDKLVSYGDILANLASNEWTQGYDEVAQAPYASSSDGTFVTYENGKSTKAKCDYVNQNNLGGIMIWDMSFDAPDAENSLAKTAYDSLDNVDNGNRDSPYQSLSNYCNIDKEFKVDFDPNGEPGKAKRKGGGSDAPGVSRAFGSIFTALSLLIAGAGVCAI